MKDRNFLVEQPTSQAAHALRSTEKGNNEAPLNNAPKMSNRDAEKLHEWSSVRRSSEHR